MGFAREENDLLILQWANLSVNASPKVYIHGNALIFYATAEKYFQYRTPWRFNEVIKSAGVLSRRCYLSSRYKLSLMLFFCEGNLIL